MGDEVAFEEIQQKARDRVEGRIKDFQIEEDVDKTAHLIADIAIQELISLNGNFKWIINCIVSEEDGACLISESTAYWDPELDGAIHIDLRKEKYILHLSIFCIAL